MNEEQQYLNFEEYIKAVSLTSVSVPRLGVWL